MTLSLLIIEHVKKAVTMKFLVYGVVVLFGPAMFFVGFNAGAQGVSLSVAIPALILSNSALIYWCTNLLRVYKLFLFFA